MAAAFQTTTGLTSTSGLFPGTLCFGLEPTSRKSLSYSEYPLVPGWRQGTEVSILNSGVLLPAEIWGHWNLSELEFVRIHFYSKLEFVGIGTCQNWKLSELEFVMIGIVRIGIFQNWNLSEIAIILFGAKNAI